MDNRAIRRIGDFIKDRNIVLKGADAAIARGFTQVPNFLLKSNKLSSGDVGAARMTLLAATRFASGGRAA
jgi:hypothetical protein